MGILEISKLIQFNNKAEAQAIEDYTAFLESLESSTLEEEMKAFIKSVIDEIISDELNHQQKLQELYTALTDVEPNKN